MKPRFYSAGIAIAICFLSAAVIAQPNSPIKLTCEGELQKFSTDEKYKLKGIYVKIDGSTIEVGGAVGFDGEYTISKPKDYIVIFVTRDNILLEGSLKRFSGDISLLRWTDQQQRQLAERVTAVCVPAIPLF